MLSHPLCHLATQPIDPVNHLLTLCRYTRGSVGLRPTLLFDMSIPCPVLFLGPVSLLCPLGVGENRKGTAMNYAEGLIYVLLP